ncbi:bifunctional hydroxyethylthiazole kinase/thiamine-phosphate diphosphorylase Ecym_2185 [Eremothecium cymbalariae DBVPG|uniref:Thiamine phosphate synthase/TenI domain-containing protein n=1 Tax=Eremothecium cymbalariae (strain CBS 270.75 / DBVPG 7215 / KCTC 17166 / NRRL Y-17582) TaxID=931890 RepID=G8JP29_ERECY|nr:Hypothetical protein Ecym_2185 [Eremothecium cymbalariae DBVPG\
MIEKCDVNYRLYLVTDSDMLPDGKSFEHQVESALKGGVTLVQLREKECESKEFLEKAYRLKDLCSRYNVPLIINDRVDIALAVDADGVHVGQSDIPVPVVRKLLGPKKIIGLSVGYSHEVEQLAEWGPGCVDYIGIGMIFSTATKKNPKKHPMGTDGAITILDALEKCDASWCRSVLIGGIHLNNVARVLLQSASTSGRRATDGIAVVSEIMASTDALSATVSLRKVLDSGRYPYISASATGSIASSHEINVQEVTDYLHLVSGRSPLVVHITNRVHENLAANISLALGGSPIITSNAAECYDLARIKYGSLFINTGTILPLDSCLNAAKAYNDAKLPIVFDPAGYSATKVRFDLNNQILKGAQFTCIKGNAGEISSLDCLSVATTRGVDASDVGKDISALICSARNVAYRYRTVVVLTGEHDIIVDGSLGYNFNLTQGNYLKPQDLPTYVIHAGSFPIISSVTATGCSLGTVIASILGAISDLHSVYHAVIAAAVIYKAAGRIASQRAKGNGSYQTELLDALYMLARCEREELISQLLGCDILIRRV